MSNSGINFKKTNHLKKDSDKEMKEYAETAMNELLGWYGYDKMNTGDTQALNLSLFSASTSFSSRKRRSATATAPPSDGSSSSSSEDSIGGINSNSSISPARRDGSVSPSNSAICVPAGCASCGWCHKIGPMKCFAFKMANCNKVFCSEVCFTHYRRANFKRNKTCDWCRHIRHTVNYVDLQDGDSQYQFCSDKCLNQFKLDIFCQETKEHLEIHPHHQEQLQNMEGSSLSTLITPDLWLKNCTSPPSSDKSRSSTPTNVSPSPPNGLSIDTKQECHPSTSEEPCKKKCKKYPNDSTKKKKMKKSNVKSLFPIQIQKSTTDNPSNLPKSSQNHTETTTPRIPFYPNFSSMLPPNVLPPDYLHRSQIFQPLVPSNFSPSRPLAPPLVRSCMNNSQIPPLLPITRPPPIPNSNPPQQPPPPPTPLPATLSATSPSQISSLKSLLPPATVLVPYPIILPLPIPIPIPIPLPFFLNDAKKSESVEDDDEASNEVEEDIQPSPPSPTTLPVQTKVKGSKNKKRKKKLYLRRRNVEAFSGKLLK